MINRHMCLVLNINYGQDLCLINVMYICVNKSTNGLHLLRLQHDISSTSSTKELITHNLFHHKMAK